MRLSIFIFFYYPLIMNLINVQAFISKFISPSIAQVFAYSNVFLILIGVFKLIRQKKQFAPIIKLWFIFFISYFIFALIANIVMGTSPPILKSTIPVIYLFGFATLLSNPTEREPTTKILAVSFFITCILLIVLNYFNFSLDYDGIYQYKLERAGGVYGDANSAALSSIMSLIFIKNAFEPQKKIGKILKNAALIISIYAILITFSKTGLVILFIVLAIMYRKIFYGKKIIFFAILIPILLFFAYNWAINTSSLSQIQKDRIENVINILSFQTQNIQLSDRDILFKNMMSHINTNPIIGNGISFSNIIRGHNTIFGVWADAGIIPFILFISLITLYYKKIFLSNNKIKFFTLPILITLTLFMLSLQSIINQGYLMVVFVLIGYLVETTIITKKTKF